MASTFSQTLRLELIGDGDQSGIWGQTTNTNLGTLLEQAITGVVNITMADANYTLTNFNGVSDEARNAVLVVGGTNNAVRDIIAPLVKKLYVVRNSTVGGYAVIIRGSSGASVSVPNGGTVWVYCDGTNFNAIGTETVGNFEVNGNLSVTGTTNLTGALNASTGTFSGSLALGGTPTAPTASPGTNTTQIATTAFVLANGVPSGAIMMWSGSIASIPSGWLLCNGTSGTPDLRDRFIVGAGSSYAVGATGGTNTNTLSTAQLPAHTHSISASGTTNTESNGHTHTFSGTTGAMNQNATHTHGYNDPGHAHSLPSVFYQSFPNGFAGGGGAGQVINATGAAFTGISIVDANIDHAHAYSGTTSNISANHNHTFSFSGTSGSTGSGSAIENRPPYYALAYIMKL